MNVKTQTRFHAREGADRAFCDVLPLCDCPRDFFFVVLAGWQILNRPSGFLYAAQCGCFDTLTNLIGMRAEILEQNMIGPKVAIQSKRVYAILRRDPRNINRSNPLNTPWILSEYFAVNACIRGSDALYS